MGLTRAKANGGSATSTAVALTTSLRSLFPSGSRFGSTSMRVNSSAVIFRCGLALVLERGAACASPMPYDPDRTVIARARQKRSALRTAFTLPLTARSIGEDEPARKFVRISVVCRGST